MEKISITPGSDLRSCKGQLAVVKLQQPLEIDEHSLGGFRSQEPFHKSRGSDGRGEHEIEGDALSDGVARRRRGHLEFGDDLVHLHVVQIVETSEKSRSFFLRED